LLAASRFVWKSHFDQPCLDDGLEDLVPELGPSLVPT
jgi:hypothetical protein